MADRRAHTGKAAVFGAIPGVVVFMAGMIVGGEAALSFGAIGIAMVVLGAVFGAIVGSLHVETVAGKVGAGAMLGAAPGFVFNLLRMGYPVWINLLVVLVGAAIGAGIGYWLGHRSPPAAPAH